MKTLRIRLVVTRRSDLLCIRCGGFLGAPPTPPRKPHWAVVAALPDVGAVCNDDASAEVGLHKYCESAMKVTFTRQRKTPETQDRKHYSDAQDRKHYSVEGDDDA